MPFEPIRIYFSDLRSSAGVRQGLTELRVYSGCTQAISPVHQPFHISICISNLPTHAHTTFIYFPYYWLGVLITRRYRRNPIRVRS